MEVNDAKEMSVRKYEDMDQEFVLGSGLQCPVSEKPPPLPPRKYEDANPDGQSIIVLGSGLQCSVFEEPPPLPPRKHKDTDPHDDPVFVLSSESHHDMRDRDNEDVGRRNDKSDRKYEDGDLAGENIFVLSQGLHRAAPNKLPARRPENKQESSTDHTSDTPEGTGGKEQDSPGFCHDVRAVSWLDTRKKEAIDIEQGKTARICNDLASLRRGDCLWCGSTIHHRAGGMAWIGHDTRLVLGPANSHRAQLPRSGNLDRRAKGSRLPKENG
ncbi:hypothetical protein Bbelb_344350 [Branchiostoma belcheri]|nr:hypothetical protein Bbelb_344350 [Branchiostoma belcheri]